MKLSIVTITYNNFSDLQKTLTSLDGVDAEKIVINGGHCERTKKFLEHRKDIISISEKDEGISDAFNKGIRLCSNQNIWILNSGDLLYKKEYLLWSVEQLKFYDYTFANLIVEKNNAYIYQKPVLNYRIGMGMPYQHPTMIIKKSIYNKVGLYKTNYRVVMDYDLICRIHKEGFKGSYYNQNVVLMNGNGISSHKIWLGHFEIGRALLNNKLYLDFAVCYMIKTFKLVIKTTLYKIKLGFLYEGIKKLKDLK